MLKPGGHLLVFGSTRTYHRLAAGVEDAGFEIRDTIAWLFGSGFPKSLDVGKAIDNAGGAAGWDGWGTALKPAFEPIVVARKPLVGTVAATVLAHGTGALNIDGCRIETPGGSPSQQRRASARRNDSAPGRPGTYRNTIEDRTSPERYVEDRAGEAIGRWPANVVLDPGAGAILDEQTGVLKSGDGTVMKMSGADRDGNTSAAYGVESRPAGTPMVSYGDAGGASRFFYCAKASSGERNAGLDGLPVVAEKRTSTSTSTIHNGRSGSAKVDDRVYEPRPCANTHPTVKPIELMRWLIRLVTPEGGNILDPFAGSGTTGCAAALEQVDFVGIERDPEYIAIAEARISWWAAQTAGISVADALDGTARRRRAADSGQLDLLAE